MKIRVMYASNTKCSMLQVQCYRTNIDGGHGWCAVCTDKAKRGEPGFCDPELVNMDLIDVEPGILGIITSAANRLIGKVVQSRRRPLIGPSTG